MGAKTWRRCRFGVKAGGLRGKEKLYGISQNLMRWKGWEFDGEQTVNLYRITRDTNLWRKGQKVWEVFGTGAQAALVIGRFRNKGRWIKGWVHVQDKNGVGFFNKPNAKWVGNVSVRASFWKHLESLGL